MKKNGDNKYSISGNIKINTYYYEEGNIQFNLDKNFNTDVTSDSEGEEFAKEVIDFIQNCENESQINLDKLFENLSDQYIKPLRRKLPSNYFLFFYSFLVNGCKMNWNLEHQKILK